MSVQALTAVLDRSRARLGPRLVLIAIANHADERGERSYPKLETLGNEAGLSVRQVQRCLAQLEALGELEVITRENTSNLYRILLNELSTGSTTTNCRGDKSGPEMSNKPSRTSSIKVPGVSGDKSGSDLSRRRSLRDWERQPCPQSADHCNRRSTFCDRCARERRELSA